MISDFDETLKQLLIKKVPLDPAQVDISFEAPDREWAASVSKLTVNLYLHDIGKTMNCTIMTESWNAMRIGRGCEDNR